MFFVVFGLNTDPAAIPPVIGWALVLAVATTLTKLATGWFMAVLGPVAARVVEPVVRWQPFPRRERVTPGPLQP